VPTMKPLLASKSQLEDRFDRVAGEIPSVLLDALFEQDPTERKLPRAVVVGHDEVVVYQACKAVSADDLWRLDELAIRVATMEEIKGVAGKEIRKVILAAYCDQSIRLQALERGIAVLTRDGLV
jgi:hypothetical protein